MCKFGPAIHGLFRLGISNAVSLKPNHPRAFAIQVVRKNRDVLNSWALDSAMTCSQTMAYFSDKMFYNRLRCWNTPLPMNQRHFSCVSKKKKPYQVDGLTLAYENNIIKTSELNYKHYKREN